MRTLKPLFRRQNLTPEGLKFVLAATAGIVDDDRRIVEDRHLDSFDNFFGHILFPFVLHM